MGINSLPPLLLLDQAGVQGRKSHQSAPEIQVSDEDLT